MTKKDKGRQKCLGVKLKFFVTKGQSDIWSEKFLSVPSKLGARSAPCLSRPMNRSPIRLGLKTTATVD